MADAAHESATQFCTFFVDKLYFGIDVSRVQEALLYQDVTPVPKASHRVRGLINVRGQIFTSIDLRRCLGFEDLEGDTRPVNIVVRDGESTVSLLVDRMSEVLELGDEDFEPPPDTLRGVSRELIRGAYKLENRLMLVLDTEKTVEAAVN